MVLKTFSPGCGVRASLMLFFVGCNIRLIHSVKQGGNYGSPLHYTQAGQGMQLIIIQGQSVPTQHVASTQQQYSK